MLCAGIDVSKPHLDLALVSTAAKPTRLRFPSTPEGRRDLLAHLGGPGAHGRLPPPPPPASGREGPPGGPGQPYHLAAFRRATGERHKTDRQDALLLARYAQVYGEGLRAYTLPPKALQELKALVGCRENLAQRERAILNQLEAAR